MAKAKKKKAPAAGAPKPITFVLTPAQRARLKSIGLREKQAIVLRAKFSRGRLVITHHQLPNLGFTPSNAAFA